MMKSNLSKEDEIIGKINQLNTNLHNLLYSKQDNTDKSTNTQTSLSATFNVHYNNVFKKLEKLEKKEKNQTKKYFKIIRLDLNVNLNKRENSSSQGLLSNLSHQKRVFMNYHNSSKRLNVSSPKSNIQIKEVEPNSRGTIYRGVSRNGNKFQVLTLIGSKRRYVGTYNTVEEAGRAYDRAVIQFHKEKARTNYQYTKEEFESILNEPPIIDIKTDRFSKY